VLISCAQEKSEERWRPILGVEAILISVISMLSDPNNDSPANIDAGVMWRDHRDEYKKICRRIVRKSQEML
jgi:ubiquitin-conjugating enzyme E2 G1